MADIQSLFRETIAEFMENGLEADLDEELGYSKYDFRNKETDNSRNGHSSKKLKTSFGDVEVSTPRDRKGEFEPQLLKKNQTSISQDIEEKILSMYAKGMTTSDIETHIRDIYGVEVSDTTISRITDKILPIVREWQQRPLESTYAVVFMDAIHYHVRSEGQIVKKAVYIAIGIDLEGRKDDVRKGAEWIENRHGGERIDSYYIAKEVQLEENEFFALHEDLLAERDWVREFSNQDHPMKDGAVPAIRVTCKGSLTVLIIDPQGFKYPRYVGLEYEELFRAVLPAFSLFMED
ncbi:MAG: transposase [Clostridia bacterium]|nr:transposase [Clostridia bacterium]